MGTRGSNGVSLLNTFVSTQGQYVGMDTDGSIILAYICMLQKSDLRLKLTKTVNKTTSAVLHPVAVFVVASTEGTAVSPQTKL